MHNLCPEALCRVVVTRNLGVVNRTLLAGCLNSGCLGYAGVVLPKNEHCVGIILELLFEREGLKILVGKTRCAGSRINRDCTNVRCNLLVLIENAVQNIVQTLQVVQRVLTETALARIAVQTIAPTLVVVYRLGKLLSGVCIYQNRTHGIRAVIKANNKILFHNIYIVVCFIASSLRTPSDVP